MSKTVFTINDLSGYAWECAIRNIYNVLNSNIGLDTLDLTQTMGYESIANELKIRFDANGDII